MEAGVFLVRFVIIVGASLISVWFFNIVSTVNLFWGLIIAMVLYIFWKELLFGRLGKKFFPMKHIDRD